MPKESLLWLEQLEQQRLNKIKDPSKVIDEQLGNLTDAEIFAIASQCEIDLESELHLLNYLVTITAQVKS